MESMASLVWNPHRPVQANPDIGILNTAVLRDHGVLGVLFIPNAVAKQLAQAFPNYDTAPRL
jgi:hypothetical protein